MWFYLRLHKGLVQYVAVHVCMTASEKRADCCAIVFSISEDLSDVDILFSR